ncbi:hypothetical protein [Spirosoma validum]|uniref:hypothetical protein n=1 Tax=Spirosoma validum TaxID=2771355 RepID=UPI00168BD94B|nr:hypothetical protein [Spirosoma validum]
MRTLGLVVVSLLISYVCIAYLSDEWKPFHWKVESQAWALVGEVTFLVLFLLFRHKLNKD